jgi:hypothetical protein
MKVDFQDIHDATTIALIWSRVLKARDQMFEAIDHAHMIDAYEVVIEELPVYPYDSVKQLAYDILKCSDALQI